jgi:hypothetical protein
MLPPPRTLHGHATPAGVRLGVPHVAGPATPTTSGWFIPALGGFGAGYGTAWWLRSPYSIGAKKKVEKATEKLLAAEEKKAAVVAPGAPPAVPVSTTSGWFLPALGGFAANQAVHWAARHWDGSHDVVPVTSGRMHLWGLREGPRGEHRFWGRIGQPFRRFGRWFHTSGALFNPELRLRAHRIVQAVRSPDPLVKAKGEKAVKILNERVLAGGEEAGIAQTLLDVVRRIAGI